MYKKISTVLVLALLALGVFPSIAAAVDANATLQGNAPLVPGNAQTFTVQVRNPGSAGVFGVGRGTSYSYIEVLKTSNLRNIACATVSPQGSWSCGVDRGQAVFLTGDTLDPGETVTIAFTADVNSNFDKDRTQSLRVYTQDQGSNSLAQANGALAFTVASLQVVADSLKVTAPAGVVDNSGTEGQTITVAYDVKSLAQAAITVPAELRVGGTTVGTSNITVPAGGTTTATFSYTLPSAGNAASVPVNFGTRVAGADATAIGSAALAVTSQHAQRLSLNAAKFNKPVLNGEGTTVALSIEATPQFLPDVTGLTGSLSFAGNTATLENTAIDADGGPVTLTFAPTSITAADGVYDVAFTFAGTDANGAAYSQQVTLEDLIRIDNIIPKVTVNLAGPSGQAQVRDGNTLSVSGTIDDGAIDRVELVAEDSTVYPVAVTQNGQNFSGSIQLQTGVDYTSVKATAYGADAAGNPGQGDSPQILDVDNVVPLLDPTARIVEGADYGSSENLIEVVIDDAFPVRGGCDPAHYSVDGGFRVTSVKFSDGTTCQDGSVGPDNTRYLVVDNLTGPELDQDALYNVQYSVQPSSPTLSPDPIRDGAVNQAVSTALETVSGIAPDVPDLLNLTRNATAEDAVFENDTFWTRFPGRDAEATISNTRADYMIQVLDQNNQPLETTPADGPNGTTIIPIGSAEGQYLRKIRLINASGLVSPTLDVLITLDMTEPTMIDSTVDLNGDNDTVTITFSEVLYTGSNRAIDWTVHETNRFQGQGDDPTHMYRPESVTGSGTTRVLNVDLLEEGPYEFTDYFFRSEIGGGLMYEDYAGNNLLNNTVS